MLQKRRELQSTARTRNPARWIHGVSKQNSQKEYTIYIDEQTWPMCKRNHSKFLSICHCLENALKVIENVPVCHVEKFLDPYSAISEGEFHLNEHISMCYVSHASSYTTEVSIEHCSFTISRLVEFVKHQKQLQIKIIRVMRLAGLSISGTV